MSTDVPNSSDPGDESNLKSICEDIVDDDGFSDEIQTLASGLLDSIRSGEFDAK